MRSKLPKALSDERKRKEVEEKQREAQRLEEELGKGVVPKRKRKEVEEKQREAQRLEEELGKGVLPKKEMKDKNRTYNLLDIKEAVQIKPQDYSKTINTKEFQFVQKPKDGMANYTSEVTKQKKGKGLRSKYDLT